MIMMPMRRVFEQNWLPTFFNDFFDNDWMPRTNATAPAINVMEDDQSYKIEVAAPGMTKDDFNVSLTDEDHITIALEKKCEDSDENKEKRFLRREFSYSKFQQTMALPDDVDKEHISASVTDGVLTINLQKKAVEAKTNESRVIEIQ